MTVRGIDLSHNNRGPIDFNAVKAAGYSFVHLKSSEGQHGRDPLFPDRARAAHGAGLLVGSYHFGHPGNRPHDDATNYLAAINGTPLDLPLVLDLETSDGQPASKVADWGNEFLHALPTGAWVYSMDSWFSTVLRDVGQHRWVARIGSKPRNDWDVWQSSWTTKVPGVPTRCDSSVFPGSLEDFKRFCGITVPDQPDKPESSNKYGWVTPADQHSVYTFAHRRGHTGKRVIELNPHVKGIPFALRVGTRLRLR